MISRSIVIALFISIVGICTATRAAESSPSLTSNGTSSPKAPESITNIDKFEGRTLEAACRMSEWIGDCEYVGYSANGPISLSNPPIARFRYGQYGTTLKGPPLGHELPVRFEFDRPLSQETQANWKFTPSMMPPLNSRWIIFIPNLVPVPGKGFSTYKGNYGRMPATAESLKAVQDELALNGGDYQRKIESSQDFQELNKAFTESEWIAECEYRGYKENGKITLKNSPTADFCWVQVFKGPPLSMGPKIYFEFDPPKSEEEERNWTFAPSMMPEMRSRWIIFVQNAVPIPGKGFLTYKGSLGRIPATPENRKVLNAIIEKHHGNR